MVDDEIDIAHLYREILEERGYEVLLAFTGLEAIALLQSEIRVDFLLLDLVMPEMNGWEILRFLRKKQNLCDPTVIVMSGGDFRSELAQFPGIEFLEKPFPFESLLQFLERGGSVAA